MSPTVAFAARGRLVAAHGFVRAEALGRQARGGHAFVREIPHHGFGALAAELEIHVALAARVRMAVHANSRGRILAGRIRQPVQQAVAGFADGRPAGFKPDLFRAQQLVEELLASDGFRALDAGENGGLTKQVT